MNLTTTNGIISISFLLVNIMRDGGCNTVPLGCHGQCPARKGPHLAPWLPHPSSCHAPAGNPTQWVSRILTVKTILMNKIHTRTDEHAGVGKRACVVCSHKLCWLCNNNNMNYSYKNLDKWDLYGSWTLLSQSRLIILTRTNISQQK